MQEQRLSLQPGKQTRTIWKVVSADPFDKTELRDISDVEAEIVQQ